MGNLLAIHFNVTAVSALYRRAILTFRPITFCSFAQLCSRPAQLVQFFVQKASRFFLRRLTARVRPVRFARARTNTWKIGSRRSPRFRV
jgi:hypothetical protein